ncbi:hypothetical protein [Inhella proteolytica]|uniref:Alpha/beta hydrolase n=1 Tax=Inhella proteolytica TaxID=2795029 RepID=A0A931J110_9BURK|nr:hypothetical protein [Inhella proteolytica]MBH9577506.1 hypothetical protein [Inhella proteolytica]
MRLSLALLVLALAACAGGPPRAQPDAARVEAFRAQGWAAGAALQPEPEQLLLWGQGDAALPYRLALPAAPGPRPLIVYLPGLGEGPEAGQRWREAWVRAGYAVLSVQALAEDGEAWRSPLARQGEFAALAAHHQGLRGARLQRLGAFLAALPTALPAPWAARLDLRRAGLAGYDLGADAALHLAAQAGSGWAWQGLLLISAPAEGPSPAAGLPLLGISGPGDGDALRGLDDGRAAGREALFHRAPLLWLRQLSHLQFSGSAEAERAQSEGRAQGGGGEHGGAAGGRGRRGGGGGMPAKGGRTGGDGRDGPMAPVPPGLNAHQLTLLSQERVAVQTVSTAFWDATLRGDTAARQWLREQAPAWLAPVGELRGGPAQDSASTSR